jgi:aspartate racemase
MIGIIGGMGPEATVDFYREIIRATPARKDQDHIPVVIYSNPQIPERTKAILEGGESPLPRMIDTARLLEKAGAGLLAMPCNTAHYYYAQLQASVKIPILHMVEETLSAFGRHFADGRAAGLLATTGTVRSGIYQNTFARRKIEVLVPGEADQSLIMSGIERVKAGTHDRDTALRFESIGSSLIKCGAQAVILGCTEIPLAFDEGRVDYLAINATRLLAQAAVAWALGRSL